MKKKLDNTLNWWVCDNIVHPAHSGQLGLLSLNEPQVFILLRDGDCVFAEYEEFRDNIAELNFLRPQDRTTANIEQIMIEAYNFLVLQDEEEERRYLEEEYL